MSNASAESRRPVGSAPNSIGLGAIWIYALEGSINADIEVVGNSFLDNTYNAIMLVSDFPVKDLYTITNVHLRMTGLTAVPSR